MTFLLYGLPALALVFLLTWIFLDPKNGLERVYGSRKSPEYRQSIRQPDPEFDGRRVPKPLLDFYANNPLATDECLVGRGIGPQDYIIEWFLPIDGRLKEVKATWYIELFPFAVTPSHNFYVLETDFEQDGVWVHTLGGQRFKVSSSLDEFLGSISRQEAQS